MSNLKMKIAATGSDGPSFGWVIIDTLMICAVLGDEHTMF